MDSKQKRHDCGLCNKTHLLRIDKHFKTVHGLNPASIEWNHAVKISRNSTEIQQACTWDCMEASNGVGSELSGDEHAGGESEQSAVQSTSQAAVQSTGEQCSEPREQCSVMSPSTDSESDGGGGGVPSTTEGLRDAILNDYATYIKGINPSVKRIDNSNTTMSRVREFLRIMSEDKSDEGLCFLGNYMRVYEWYRTCEGRGLAPSTLKLYRSDVRSFLKYLVEFRPNGLQAKASVIRKLLLCLAKIDRDSRQSLATHMAQFRRRCRDEVLSAAELKQFLDHSNASIPSVLSRLEVRATSSDRRRFAALMSSRLAIFNGTRRAPVTMFGESDFNEITRESGVYQMTVASHKTNYSFGECRIVISDEEYTWLQRFHRIRPHLSGMTPETTLFFFTCCGKPYGNLCDFVGKIFAELGIGRKVTFGTIRRSIATLNFNLGSLTDRGTVADHMCHSLETQARYYRSHNLPHNASQARRLIEGQIIP